MHHTPSRGLQRSAVFGIFLLCFLAAACGQARAAESFGFEQVTAKAKTLADQPFQAPPPVPEFLQRLDYDAWRSLRYRPEKALWRGEQLPFEAQFYHPGYHYDHPVDIQIANQYGVGHLAFEKKRFVYPNPSLREKVPADLGYAGLRLHYALNHDDYKDEVASFLGASYFRAVGRGQHYGLSARGLAVDTALPSGEEFPYFKTFWLQEPDPEADRMTVYALLDSASITGAYRFVIKPGASTVMDVEARLFPRKKIDKLGIAPLTSMFMFGETRNSHSDDTHPELHDSDGLMIATATGEWIWRPLVNPGSLAVNSFVGECPKGFGLMQRDRHFDHYRDAQAHYEQRPSLWVMPQGDWGAGHLELVQIPSDSEKNDNIVAYWVPDTPVQPGQPLHFAYRLAWQMQEPTRPPGGYVVATYTGRSELADQHDGTVRKVMIDFTGPRLREMDADAVVNARIDVGDGGKLLQARTWKNEAAGEWRVAFHVARKNPDTPLELRAYLADGDGGALTETWSYALHS